MAGGDWGDALAGVLAQDAGIGREALHKALLPDASPPFDTVARVCKALRVKLVAQGVVV